MALFFPWHRSYLPQHTKSKKRQRPRNIYAGLSWWPPPEYRTTIIRPKKFSFQTWSPFEEASYSHERPPCVLPSRTPWALLRQHSAILGDLFFNITEPGVIPPPGVLPREPYQRASIAIPDHGDGTGMSPWI